MKFKMSEKSLFAILLRSPWWVSLLLTAVLATLAGALLPLQYKLVGVLGTFPFWVIAAMAAWRQWRAPSPARVEALLARLSGLSWPAFSELLEQALARQGYRYQAMRDPAADYRLERQGQVTLLSCRRWKAAHPGVEGLRALEAACSREGASGLYLSLAPVSVTAARHAQTAGLRLVHGQALAALLLA